MNNKMQNDRPLGIGGLRRRKGLCRFLASVAAAMFLFVSTAPALADTTSVLGGNAELTGLTRATLDSNGANAAVFSSSSASAVLDWAKFNVGARQSMSFNGASTTFFNLVDGAAGKSQIDGMINGSGNVWVINPAGIAFGAGSSVNVGGLFAAAAGNLENAAALRDGTATMPSFSSFAGEVDASKGSFTASQVALMGKTVSAGGDFSGAGDLSIAATGGAVEIDDVEGGKVSVDLGDFTVDDAEVLLGELAVGGGLSAKSTGKIATLGNDADASAEFPKLMKATSYGPKHVDGDISFSASELDIDGDVVSSGGSVVLKATAGDMNVNAAVEAFGDVSLSADGAMNVSADVTSHNGDIDIASGSGALTVDRNAVVDARGDSATVTLKGTTEFFGAGDVTVAGKVVAGGDGGSVYLYAANGMLSEGNLNVSGEVVADQVFLTAGLTCPYNDLVGLIYPESTYGAGSVTIDGHVTGASRVMVGTDSSDVTIGENAVVKTTGENAALDVFAGFGMFTAGNVNVGGRLEAERSGSIELTSGFGRYSDGNVTLLNTGSVTAGGNATFYAGFDSVIYGDPGQVELFGLTGYGGAVMFNGNVTAGNGVYANSVSGVMGNGNVTVNSADGKVVMNGGLGSVLYAGKIVASQARLDTTQYRDYGVSGAKIELVNSDNAVGELTAGGASIRYAGSSDLTLGDVTVAGDARIYMYGGDATVKAGAEVRAGGSVVIGTGLLDDGPAGDIVVNGSVEAATTVQLSANGDVKIGEAGHVASLDAGAKVFIAARARNDKSGSVVVKGGGGVVSDNLYVDAEGSATVEKNAKLTSAGENGSVSVFAAEGAGADADLTIEGAVEAIGESGNVWLITGASGNAHGDVRVAEDANVTAKGKAVLWAKSSGDVSVESGGTVVGEKSTSLYTLDGNVSVGEKASVRAGKVYVSAVYDEGAAGGKGSVSVGGSVVAKEQVIVESGNGGVSVVGSGTVAATEEDGIAYIAARGTHSDVLIEGTVSADAARGRALVRSAGNVGGSGSVTIAGDGRVSSGESSQVIAGGDTMTRGNVIVNGLVSSKGESDVATYSGDIAVNGVVSGADGVKIVTGINGGRSGDIYFGSSGCATSGNYVDLFATQGNLLQNGNAVRVSADGYAEVVGMTPAVVAPTININVSGDVGGNGYFSGSGTFFGLISGNAALSAAYGRSFVGGSKPNHAPTFDMTAVELQKNVSGTDINTSANVHSVLATSVNWDGADGNSSVVADGNLSIYTADSLDPYGLFVAGRDLTVTAASFGDMSYLRAGGTLTINNVGHPAHPQIAYFESVDGNEPKINNQPNDTVIFVDGRLAGGNLQIINKFGATEAFPVSTPELKSEQGIFGNPVFMHGDLDVANPMAVGNVDYMLQEIPRLTLASDFPLEVDKSVNTAGLNPKDVYRFGQHPQVAEEKPQMEQKEKKDDKAAAEQPAEPKVAMR